tara:strand:- start:917 stop:1537 length:621 start_codon:yes stop_codon:yes gene_type:complete
MPTAPSESTIATLWFPLFGVLLSNVLYMAPMPAVYKAYKRGALGDLNVLPLAFMSVSTISWLAYAFSVPNPFIVASNLPGAVVAMAYTVITLPLVRSPFERQAMQGVMVGSVGIVSLLWCAIQLHTPPLPHVGPCPSFTTDAAVVQVLPHLLWDRCLAPLLPPGRVRLRHLRRAVRVAALDDGRGHLHEKLRLHLRAAHVCAGAPN